ncbi:hypothetical protein SDC9_21509 [bioreactor metagenome]|uniref:Uncharacterized protein n=1 Tax=bioreactor metagenome TaxID=1076179 RepID=A0A644U9Q7_9ZZZZ|nr:hypothetical protein [Methanobrevibacter sp.]MEA4956665.1 hypothetical protein [Methanobrevibacter sp.]
MTDELEIIEKLLKVNIDDKDNGIFNSQIETINDLVVSDLSTGDLIDVLIGIQIQRVSLGFKNELENKKLNNSCESAVENLIQLLNLKGDTECDVFNGDASIEINPFNINP